MGETYLPTIDWGNFPNLDDPPDVTRAKMARFKLDCDAYHAAHREILDRAKKNWDRGEMAMNLSFLMLIFAIAAVVGAIIVGLLT